MISRIVYRHFLNAPEICHYKNCHAKWKICPNNVCVRSPLIIRLLKTHRDFVILIVHNILSL